MGINIPAISTELAIPSWMSRAYKENAACFLVPYYLAAKKASGCFAKHGVLPPYRIFLKVEAEFNLALVSYFASRFKILPDFSLLPRNTGVAGIFFVRVAIPDCKPGRFHSFRMDGSAAIWTLPDDRLEADYIPSLVLASGQLNRS
jgi:hypothetical protein